VLIQQSGKYFHCQRGEGGIFSSANLVLDLRKKTLGPAGSWVFRFCRQLKFIGRQKFSALQLIFLIFHTPACKFAWLDGRLDAVGGKKNCRRMYGKLGKLREHLIAKLYPSNWWIQSAT